MNSRQRVINAIENKPVDRFPIDFGGHFSSGISAFAYKNLRDYLGLCSKNIEIIDMVQMLSRVDDDILERFHVDVVPLFRKFSNTKRYNYRGDYEFIVPDSFNPELKENGDITVEFGGQKIRMPDGGFFFDGGWPDFSGLNYDEILKITKPECERLFKETDYFILNPRAFYAFFKPDNMDWQCKMLTDPDEIIEENELFWSYTEKDLIKMIDTYGENMQGIMLNADLGTQTSTFVRPEIFNELCAPYIKRFCDFVHNNSCYKVLIHSCGAISALIPTFIECGIDAVNPVQISASGMEPEKLQGEFGKKIAFWGGGVNTQHVLGMKGSDEVIKNVNELTNIFKKTGSGYIFNPVHNVMGDVPPENIVAAFSAAYANSKYEN